MRSLPIDAVPPIVVITLPLFRENRRTAVLAVRLAEWACARTRAPRPPHTLSTRGTYHMDFTLSWRARFRNKVVSLGTPLSDFAEACLFVSVAMRLHVRTHGPPRGWHWRGNDLCHSRVAARRCNFGGFAALSAADDIVVSLPASLSRVHREYPHKPCVSRMRWSPRQIPQIPLAFVYPEWVVGWFGTQLSSVFVHHTRGLCPVHKSPLPLWIVDLSRP